jgi:hypothetical protein
MLALGTLLALAAVLPPATLAADEAPTTREIMLALTIPTSDVVFGVGSKEPASALEWERVVANAMLLAESGRLLQTQGRDPGAPEWRAFAQSLVASARQAAAAARAKDVDRTLDAGNTLYESCEGCHAKFMAARTPTASN